MAIVTNYWTRRSPFFGSSLKAGCTGLSVANHMYQPHSYDDPIEEYRQLTEAVTLWDVATERQVEISGFDALQFTELLTPVMLPPVQLDGDDMLSSLRRKVG